MYRRGSQNCVEKSIAVDFLVAVAARVFSVSRSPTSFSHWEVLFWS